MSTLRILLRDQRRSYWPGERIEGGVAWQLDRPAKAIEVRLFYYTKGKGTTDVVVVDQVRFEQPPEQEVRPFQFQLPAGPYSFSGKLISLIWAIELVAFPGQEAERLEFTLGPGGREISLRAAAQAHARQA